MSRLERHRSLPSLQPFCPIVTKCTREVVGFNSLADVLKRLDFRSAEIFLSYSLTIFWAGLPCTTSGGSSTWRPSCATSWCPSGSISCPGPARSSYSGQADETRSSAILFIDFVYPFSSSHPIYFFIHSPSLTQPPEVNISIRSHLS